MLFSFTPLSYITTALLLVTHFVSNKLVSLKEQLMGAVLQGFTSKNLSSISWPKFIKVFVTSRG